MTSPPPPNQPPGQPPYSPGQPPYQPPYQPGPPPRRRKSPVKAIVVSVVLLGIVAVIAVVAFQARKSSPDAAKAGDCVAKQSGDNIKIVKCTESAAAYKVVGKVDNKSQVQFNISSRTICKPFTGTTSAYWRGESGGKGYVLCLGPVK